MSVTCAKPAAPQGPSHGLSMFCPTCECGLAPGEMEAFTVIEKGFGILLLSVNHSARKNIEMCMERLWEGQYLKATMTFIKHKRKDKILTPMNRLYWDRGGPNTGRIFQKIRSGVIK